MTTTALSPSRSVGSSSKDRLPSFQEQLAMNPSRSSIELWNEIVTVEKEQPVVEQESVEPPEPLQLHTFPVVTNPFHHPVSPNTSAENDTTMDDLATRISARRIGSGSRSQWPTIDIQETFASLATQLGSLAATKELDAALGEDASGDDDNMSSYTYMQSEATYDHSEATAVTGNVSSNSSTGRHRVTPENSPNKGRGRSRGGGEQGSVGKSSWRNEITKSRDESPEHQPKRLVMCGAVDVNDELKGSFQDMNETVRQIFTTVRRFGPDEKYALRETFRDAQYFMREKVRSALLRKGDDDSSMGSPKRRGGRGGRSELSEKRSTVNEVQRRNMMRTPEEESERETHLDVVDESKGVELEPKATRTRLV